MSIRVKFDTDAIDSVTIADTIHAEDGSAILVLPSHVGEDEVEIEGLDTDDFNNGACDFGWVGKDGEATLLSKMKTKNIRALVRKFEENNVTSIFSGWYNALKGELDERE